MDQGVCSFDVGHVHIRVFDSSTAMVMLQTLLRSGFGEGGFAKQTIQLDSLIPVGPSRSDSSSDRNGDSASLRSKYHSNPIVADGQCNNLSSARTDSADGDTVSRSLVARSSAISRASSIGGDHDAPAVRDHEGSDEYDLRQMSAIEEDSTVRQLSRDRYFGPPKGAVSTFPFARPVVLPTPDGSGAPPTYDEARATDNEGDIAHEFWEENSYGELCNARDGIKMPCKKEQACCEPDARASIVRSRSSVGDSDGHDSEFILEVHNRFSALASQSSDCDSYLECPYFTDEEFSDSMDFG